MTAKQAWYALCYVQEDGTPKQTILSSWSMCTELMEGQSQIYVKKCKTLTEAEEILASKKHLYASAFSESPPPPSSPSPSSSYPISSKLTDEQGQILTHIIDHPTESCFITGPAGTGKSFVVKEILKYLRHASIPFSITGSTGASAVLIGGKTIHSFLGIGLATNTAEFYVSKFKNPTLRRLRKLHTLILDEVSMISSELLDKIDVLLRLVRHKPDTPFGGVRMILIGDACQLPPVVGNYFFKSNVWNEWSPRVFQLTKLMRQIADIPFQEMLMRLRWGKCSKDDYETLYACTQREWPKEMKIKPTRLYATNIDVDEENATALQELIETTRATTTEYPASCFGTTQPSILHTLQRWMASCRIPDKITLCKGAQVMVTWNVNVEAGIVNGTRGIVTNMYPTHIDIELVDGRIFPISYVSVSNEDNIDANEMVGIQFLPIKLAYAMTIHKCQGVTLDCAEVYLGDSIFEYGQAYTALTRIRSLENIKITELSKKAFRTHPSVLEFYQNLNK